MDYLKQKPDGRWVVRVVVPSRLRQIVGQAQFERAVGRDPAVAKRRAYPLIADFQRQIAQAERQLALTGGSKPGRQATRFSLSEIAHAHYGEELALDEVSRNHPDTRADMAWARPALAQTLRRIAAGDIERQEAQAVIGWAVEKFAERQAEPIPADNAEWFKLARTLALIQLEVLDREAERDAGKFDGTPALPILRSEPEALPPAPVRLDTLTTSYFTELLASGRGAEAERRWSPVFADLRRFLKHDDVLKITPQHLQEWKQDLVGRLAPKTIRDVYFTALKAVLGWAKDAGRIPDNPAAGLKMKLPRKQVAREPGFDDDEAVAVLKAAAAYQPKPSENPATAEQLPLVAAKRWTPWLCAYTGARISEMTQLRKEDVRTKDGIHYLRITSDAGSVKSGQFRDVPLHPDLIARGFLDFVKVSADGPLFYRPREDAKSATPWRTVSGRVGDWVRSLKVIDARVQPNHGWRHRFKTQALELGMNARVADAIQGHAARTAGENYGSVTLNAKYNAILMIPCFSI